MTDLSDFTKSVEQFAPSGVIGIPHWETDPYLPALLKERVLEAIPALMPRG
jgi:hypothetical protein